LVPLDTSTLDLNVTVDQPASGYTGPSSLAIAPATIVQNEGDIGLTPFTFTVTRSGDTSVGITAQVDVTGSSANPADAADFGGAFPSQTVIFLAGETSKTVIINVSGDTVVETDEQFTVTLGNPTNATTTNTTFTNTTATGTITDDDNATISLGVNPITVVEDGIPNLAYTFTRAGGDTTAELIVNYNVGGTAALATDYVQTGATTFTASSGTVTFAPNATTATVTIDPNADLIFESDETVALTLSTGTGYNIAIATPVIGTISNNDPAPEFVISSSSITEGGVVTFVVSRVGDAQATQSVTVTTSIDGTDTASANDFTAKTQTLSFAQGEKNKNFTVQTTQDAVFEGNETFTATLSAATNGATITGANGTATGTINNDDPFGNVIYANDFESSIGTEWSVTTNDNTYPSVFSRFLGRFNRGNTELTLNTVIGNLYLLEFDLYAIDSWDGNKENDFFNVSVNNQQVFHETITNNLDYTQSFRPPDIGGIGTASLGFVTFYSDSIYRKIPIAFTATDTTTRINFADSRIFTAGLNDESWGIDNIKVMEQNTLPIITLAIAPASVLEDGIANLVYTFTRTGITTSALTVNYNVSGTTTFGNDYSQTGAATFSASTGTVIFAANSATATVTIAPTADIIFEPDETIALTLVNGSGYSIDTTTPVTGTIANDESVPIFAIASANATEGGTTLFTITRTGDAQSTQSVTVTTSISATDNVISTSDFTAKTETLSFAQGETTKTFSVQTIQDTLFETNETFTATLSAPTNGAIISVTNGTATGTINNDDPAPIFAIASVSTTEGGLVNFTVTRTGDAQASQDVTVATSISSTDTTNLTDFTPKNETLTFAQGETTKIFSVQSTQDNIFESNETFTTRLSTATNGAVISNVNGFTTGTINNDDPIPKATLSRGSNDVFRLDGLSTAKLKVSFTDASSSSVNAIGFFNVDDATGKIGSLLIGSAGYAQAALERSQVGATSI